MGVQPAGRTCWPQSMWSSHLLKQAGSQLPSHLAGREAGAHSYHLSSPCRAPYVQTWASVGVDAPSSSGLHTKRSRASLDQPWADQPPRRQQERRQQQQQQQLQPQLQPTDQQGQQRGRRHRRGTPVQQQQQQQMKAASFQGDGEGSGSPQGTEDQQASSSGRGAGFSPQDQVSQQAGRRSSAGQQGPAVAGHYQHLQLRSSRLPRRKQRKRIKVQVTTGLQRQLRPPQRHQKQLDAALLTHYITQVSRLVPLQRLLHQWSHSMHGGHIALLLLRALELASSDPAGWYDGPSSPLRLYLKRLHLQRDRLRHFQAQQQQGTAAQRSVRGGGSSGSREGSAGSSSSSDSSGGGVTRRRPPVRGPLAPEVHMEAWMQLSTAIGRLARRAAKLAVRGQLSAEATSTILSCLAKLGWKQRFVVQPLLCACEPLMARPMPVRTGEGRPDSLGTSSSGSTSTSSSSATTTSSSNGSSSSGSAPWNGGSSSNSSSANGGGGKGPSIQGRPSASGALPPPLSPPSRSAPSFAAAASLPAKRAATASSGAGAAAGAAAPLVLHAQPGCSAVALANMLWAAVVLQERPGPRWMACAETCLLARMRGGCPLPVLCTCTFALGALHHQASPQLLEALEEHTVERMHEGRPVDLANLASGCAGMQHRPSDTWSSAYLSAVLPKLRGYGIPELQVSAPACSALYDLQRTLCGLAGIGCKPDDAWLSKYYTTFRAAVADAPPGTVSLSVAQMGSMTSALARLHCRPDISWLEECLAVSRHDLTRAGAAHLVRLVSALAALRFRPGSTWMQAFLTVSFQRLAFYSPGQVVALLQAFARLGHRPQGLWLDELSSKVQARLQQFSGEQLVGMMEALARLRYVPGPDWLADFERASQSKLTTEVSAGGLATIVWALAQMNHQPAPGWLYSFMLAAYRQLDLFDATQLGIVFDALPRVSPHPLWLDELVQICATESSMRERSMSSWSEEDEGWQGAASAPAAGQGSQQQQQRQQQAGPVQPDMSAGAAETSSSSSSSSNVNGYGNGNGSGYSSERGEGGNGRGYHALGNGSAPQPDGNGNGNGHCAPQYRTVQCFATGSRERGNRQGGRQSQVTSKRQGPRPGRSKPGRHGSGS